MKAAAQHHKDVPNRMRIRQALGQIENRAHGVKRATQSDQDQTLSRNNLDQWLVDQYHQPAHRQVDERRNQLEAPGKEQLKNNASRCKRPDRRE